MNFFVRRTISSNTRSLGQTRRQFVRLVCPFGLLFVFGFFFESGSSNTRIQSHLLQESETHYLLLTSVIPCDLLQKYSPTVRLTHGAARMNIKDSLYA